MEDVFFPSGERDGCTRTLYVTHESAFNSLISCVWAMRIGATAGDGADAAAVPVLTRNVADLEVEESWVGWGTLGR